MAHRSQDDPSGGLATTIVVALLSGCFFTLSVVVTLLVRTHSKHMRHPLLVGVTASWATALVMAAVLAVVVDPVVAAWSAGIATLLWCGAVAVTEILLDHRQPPPDDGDLAQQLRGWWGTDGS